jgi:uncharacterized membrane protein YeaQ/YmgE (transglycosylase-associated protein family)
LLRSQRRWSGQSPIAWRAEGHLRQRPDRCDTARNWEAVMPTLAQVVVWVIVGLIGGSLAGLLVTWRRRGFGFVRNLGMGLIGALLGGLLFRVFGLFPGLDLIVISLRDILAACAGSLLILVALWIWERSRRGP